jgi:translation initiation factor IF-3
VRRRYVPTPRKKPQQHRINRQIRVDKVRLIDQHGEQLGVVPLREALIRAEEAELDLVEVAPNADPPVCKIEDYRKVLYEKRKRERTARKKQKTVELKEVKLRPSIAVNDFEIKMAQGAKFLEAGNKVKVTMTFRGREIPTADQRAAALRERVKEALSQTADEESYSRQSARQVTMILAPKKGAGGRDDDDDEDEDDEPEYEPRPRSAAPPRPAGPPAGSGPRGPRPPDSGSRPPDSGSRPSDAEVRRRPEPAPARSESGAAPNSDESRS